MAEQKPEVDAPSGCGKLRELDLRFCKIPTRKEPHEVFLIKVRVLPRPLNRDSGKAPPAVSHAHVYVGAVRSRRAKTDEEKTESILELV